MEGHVVGSAISVGIRDVMNGAHRQDNLTHCVNDGQVYNSPARKGERIQGEISSTRPIFTVEEDFTTGENEDKEKKPHLNLPSQESAIMAPRMGVR